MMLRVSFIFLSLLAGIFGNDLPSNFNKCLLKYPEVYQCAQDEANRLIPELVKGNEELGIPSLSPIRVPRVELHAQDFDLTLINAYFDNFKDFTVSDVYFNLDYKNASLIFHADFLNITSNYIINEGKILSREVSGRGHSDISLIGNSIRYKTNLEYRKISGQTYVKTADTEVHLDVKRAYFYFEGLRSSENGIELDDTDEFIDINWKVLLDLLKPELEKGFFRSVQSALDPVHTRIPLEKLFNYE